MMRTERALGNSSMSTKTLAPRLADFPTTTVEKLRFADTDRLGHITNTVFAVVLPERAHGAALRSEESANPA